MESRAGLCLCLTSLWIIAVVQSSFRNEDLIVDECRIKGIALAKMKDGKYHFNFTSAETVCQQLGLSLASKAQVEKARMDGFETCSYGWVTDGIAVVSRIHRNEKCGQNKTGTATWNAPLAKEFNAYCFNASDTLINSCKPDPTTTSLKTTLMTTFTFEPRTTTANVAPITKTSRETQTTMQTRRDFEGYATDVAATSRWPNNVKTLITKSATQSSFLLKLTTADLDEDISTPANIKGTLKSEHVVFGGLPTALLILALIFFTAAVVLAVCYVRKYTTTLPITSKAKKTENVEVKALKETKTNTKSSNEEQNQNGKPIENPQAKSAAETAAAASAVAVAVAENSAEAEV